AHREAARARALDRGRSRGAARSRAPHPAGGGRAAVGRARSRGADGPARDHRPARRRGGAPLAGAAGMTAPPYGPALDLVTRVRGVRGAMLVSGDDGIVVAEQLMEGIKGSAVAALASSLAARLRRAMEAAGVGARLVLVMTSAGQVMAQHGFSRAVDVMSAAALGAAIMASTDEIARQLAQPPFAALNHQGDRHGIFLGAVTTGRGKLVVLVVYDLDVSSLGLVQLFFEQLTADLQDRKSTRLNSSH